MRERRVIVEQFAEGECELGGDLHQHLTRSLRLRPGDQLTLIDGKGREAHASIEAIDAEVVTVVCKPPVDIEAPQPAITVVQALGKGNKLDEVVRALSELGVLRFQPLVTARTVRRSDAQGRWQKIADEATCVSGRAYCMTVASAWSWQDFLQHASACIVLDASGQSGLAEVATQGRDAMSVLIGPEGGLSGDELSEATEHGAVLASLGSHTLRLQTAGPAAVAVIQSARGNLG